MPPKTDINEVLELQSRAYREATQMIFDTVNARVDALMKTVCDLQHSLEFTQAELKDAKSDLELSKTEISELKKKVGEQEILILKHTDRLDDMEDYSRRNNIRIDGIEDCPNETTEVLQVKVRKILEDKLQLKDIPIDRIHRVPRNPVGSSSSRTVITRFSTHSTRDACMRNKWRLKNTGIFINEDLCENTIKSRKEKLEQYKRARSVGKVAYFSGKRLVVKERQNKQNRDRESYTPPKGVTQLVNVFTPNIDEASKENNKTRTSTRLRSESAADK